MPPSPGPAPAGRRTGLWGLEASPPRRLAHPLCGGVLGTAHGIALAATAILGARVSVPLVFVVSGIIVEAGLWVVARGAGKASAT